MRRFAHILGLGTLLAACGPQPSSHETLRQGLGEPVEGFPSYSERLVLYFTNRSRTDPPSFNPEGGYAPTPPLRHDLDLARAARFHASHILDASCFCEDHSSCCPLEGTGDDVSCGGAVTGCGAEESDARVARFAEGYTGENMALGQRSAAEAVEAWTFSSGHWANMNAPGSTRLGVGNVDTAWVQDFGRGGQPHVIGDGIHFADGSSTRFGTTYYQPDTGGPRTALVIVGGECHELDLEHGTAEHGAFEASVSLDPGCHRYYFHFTDGDGVDWTYPDFGSFGVSAGGAECEFFIDTRPADTCSPSGQTCMTGDTRHCYTGPFGTEGVGICEAGVERCVGGQWNGECRLEIVPEASDTCDDGVDQDCDGVVDGGCAPEEDADDPDPDTGDDPAEPDDEKPALPKDEDASGCNAVRADESPFGGLLLFAAAIASRRRKKRSHDG